MSLNLYAKLLTIQSEITSLKADKSSTGYKYLSTDKIMDYVKPRMNDLKLLLVQEVVDFTNERMDYRVSIKEIYENNRTTNKFTEGKPKSEILTKVKMNMVWIDCESGETLSVPWGANGQNDWEKGFGSALTYGERYFVMKFFHISTDEDDVDNPNRKPKEKTGKAEKGSNSNSKGGTEKKGKTTKATSTKANTEETKGTTGDIKPISKNQVQKIQIMLNEGHTNKDNIYGFFGIESCKELSFEDAKSMIDMMEATKKKVSGKIDADQITKILSLLKQKGGTKKALLSKQKIKTLDEMSYEKATTIISALEKLDDKA